MISTEFAVNEEKDDAYLSLKLLFQPWRWKKGRNLNKAKNYIRSKFFDDSFQVFFFLTGRSALFHLFKNLKLEKGSEILIQGFTCEAVVLPILVNDLKPVYVDIEEKTLSMNIIDLKKKITNKSKILILQHTFGITPLYRKEILSLAKEKGVIIIEDLAHGFDSSLEINNTALLSFGRSKALSSVFGGAIVTKDKLLSKNLEQSQETFSFPDNGFMIKLLIYKPLGWIIKVTYDFYIGKFIHFLARKTNLLVPEITTKEKAGNFEPMLDKAYPNALSILLNNQLKKFDQMQKKRTSSSTIYEQLLEKTINHKPKNTGGMLRYPLLVKNRDYIVKKFTQKNIFIGKWYDQVVAPRELDLKRVGYIQGSCPIAEDICQKIINLPTNISEEEAKRVVSTLNDVIKI